MNETILHQFGDLCRTLLQSIPLYVVRGLFLLLISTVLVIVLRLPKSETTPAKEGPVRWDENLKVWATLALLIQFAIYCFF